MDTVLNLLEARVGWLRERGSDQWSTWLTWPAKLPESIDRGEVLLLFDGDDAVATITVSAEGDPDFWTPAELAEPALYISKLATRLDRAGQELGTRLLDWTVDHAYRTGRRFVRLDVWRSATELHDYYLKRGWHHRRTVYAEHRHSGTLFERRAEPLPITISSPFRKVSHGPS
jgi:GNAT superfamily N-acetyltransferase